MKKNLVFLSFIIIGYVLSNLVPGKHKDGAIFATLGFFYVLYLLYRKIALRLNFDRDDFLIGIPVVYGLILSVLRYTGLVEIRSIAVWIVFVFLALMSLGNMRSDEVLNDKTDHRSS